MHRVKAPHPPPGRAPSPPTYQYLVLSVSQRGPHHSLPCSLSLHPFLESWPLSPQLLLSRNQGPRSSLQSPSSFKSMSFSLCFASSG